MSDVVMSAVMLRSHGAMAGTWPPGRVVDGEWLIVHELYDSGVWLELLRFAPRKKAFRAKPPTVALPLVTLTGWEVLARGLNWALGVSAALEGKRIDIVMVLPGNRAVLFGQALDAILAANAAAAE